MVFTDPAKKLSKSYDLCLRYNEICEGGVHVDISTHRQERVNYKQPILLFKRLVSKNLWKYPCFKGPIDNKRADVEQPVAVPGVKSLSNIAYKSVPDLVFTRVSLFQILWTAGSLWENLRRLCETRDENMCWQGNTEHAPPPAGQFLGAREPVNS